ncbi:hypothetical protein TorRG33x02_308610, partial [Trema orientale]
LQFVVCLSSSPPQSPRGHSRNWEPIPFLLPQTRTKSVTIAITRSSARLCHRFTPMSKLTHATTGAINAIDSHE